MTDYLVKEFNISKRKACSLTDISRSSHKYSSKLNDDTEIRKRIKQLAHKHKRYGCPRIHAMLRKEGYMINHKRTERLYREENLQIRKKRRAKRPQRGQFKMPNIERLNQVWNTDFIYDALVNGRKLKNMPVLDLFGRRCLRIETASSIPSRRVIDVFERLISIYGVPEMILTDNGPEFTSKIFKSWADKRGIKLCYIDLGEPIQNAYMESFNDKFRDECLNENYFITTEQAQAITGSWRLEYNSERIHSSLNYMTPDEYVSEHLRLTERKTPVKL